MTLLGVVALRRKVLGSEHLVQFLHVANGREKVHLHQSRKGRRTLSVNRWERVRGGKVKWGPGEEEETREGNVYLCHRLVK